MHHIIKKVARLHIQAKRFGRYIYSPKPLGSFRNVRQESRISQSIKPNGLWYTCDNEWKEYIQRQNPSWGSSYVHKYLLDVNLNRMCVIRNEKEFLEFNAKYGVDDRGDMAIDWVKVSKDYDGIEICPYQWEFRMKKKSAWYYSWDVASGCIWGSSAFKGVTEVENDIKDNEFKDSDSSVDEEYDEGDGWEDWD
jgi:hypothetical protein